MEGLENQVLTQICPSKGNLIFMCRLYQQSLLRYMKAIICLFDLIL